MRLPEGSEVQTTPKSILSLISTPLVPSDVKLKATGAPFFVFANHSNVNIPRLHS